jgi:hypothetical protein
MANRPAPPEPPAIWSRIQILSAILHPWNRARSQEERERIAVEERLGDYIEEWHVLCAEFLFTPCWLAGGETLLEYADARAKHRASRLVRRGSPDLIGPANTALEAIQDLLKRAFAVKENPVRYLCGIIRRKSARARDKASPVVDCVPDQESDRRDDLLARAAYRRWLSSARQAGPSTSHKIDPRTKAYVRTVDEVMAGLRGALKRTAEMISRGASPKEIAAAELLAQGIDPKTNKEALERRYAAVRQRLSRIQRYIKAGLKERGVDVTPRARGRRKDNGGNPSEGPAKE